jgi:hypothetical protein
MIKFGVNSLINAEHLSLRILSVNECKNVLRRFSLGTEKHLDKLVRKFKTYNGVTVEVEDVIQKLRAYAPPSLEEPPVPVLSESAESSISSEEEVIVVPKVEPKYFGGPKAIVRHEGGHYVFKIEDISTDSGEL